MYRYIYLIRNKVNSKIYVGQSKDPARRWRCHLRASTSRKNRTPLYTAMRAYGTSSFEFEVLEKCLDDSVDDRERYWIQFYKLCDRAYGYNLESGGCGGKTLSPETRRRMSVSRKGLQNMLGRTHSPATKHTMSISRRGVAVTKMTEEIKQKISSRLSGSRHPNFGKEMSHETRAKISSALTRIGPAARQRILELRKSGVSYRKIGKALGMSSTWARKLCL